MTGFGASSQFTDEVCYVVSAFGTRHSGMGRP